MDGQADTAPSTINDLAAFLVDNPTADHEEDAAPETAKPTEDVDNLDGDDKPADEAEGASPGPDDEETDPDDPDKVATSKKPEEDQTSGRKYKVPVKGEDGADSTLEVDEKELIAGYTRHADYTRKTQELGTREREATELVERKLTEGRSHFMQQSELALRTVETLAGLKSDAEMAELAQSNPGAWVAEKQRTDAIRGVMAQIANGMQAETQQTDAKQREEATKAFHSAWGTLGKEGIDKPKLQAIFEGVAKNYGFERERFGKISDPKLVLLMRDALSFRELKEKSAAAKVKVQAAPKLPAARQSVPRQAQVNQTLDRRFRNGRAGTRDLAAWISNNNA